MDLLLQMQADQLGVVVRRPVDQETTSLGAAYLAGLAEGRVAGRSTTWPRHGGRRPSSRRRRTGPRLTPPTRAGSEASSAHAAGSPTEPAPADVRRLAGSAGRNRAALIRASTSSWRRSRARKGRPSRPTASASVTAGQVRPRHVLARRAHGRPPGGGCRRRTRPPTMRPAVRHRRRASPTRRGPRWRPSRPRTPGARPGTAGPVGPRRRAGPPDGPRPRAAPAAGRARRRRGAAPTRRRPPRSAVTSRTKRSTSRSSGSATTSSSMARPPPCSRISIPTTSPCYHPDATGHLAERAGPVRQPHPQHEARHGAEPRPAFTPRRDGPVTGA